MFRKVLKTKHTGDALYTIMEVDDGIVCVTFNSVELNNISQYTVRVYDCLNKLDKNEQPVENGNNYFISTYINRSEAMDEYDKLVGDMVSYKYTPKLTKYVTADTRDYININLVTDIKSIRGPKLRDVIITIHTYKNEEDGASYYTTINKYTLPSKRILKDFEVIKIKTYGKFNAISMHNSTVQSMLNGK